MHKKDQLLRWLFGLLLIRALVGTLVLLRFRTTAESQSPIGAPEHTDDTPATGKALLTALVESGLVGMWKDRAETKESAEFARTVRERAQERKLED